MMLCTGDSQTNFKGSKKAEASEQLKHLSLSAASSPFLHWTYPEMKGVEERIHVLYSDHRSSHIGWHSKHPSKTNTIFTLLERRGS